MPGDYKVKAWRRDERGATSDRQELGFVVGAVIVATALEEEKKGEPLSRLGYGEHFRLELIAASEGRKRELTE